MSLCGLLALALPACHLVFDIQGGELAGGSGGAGANGGGGAGASGANGGGANGGGPNGGGGASSTSTSGGPGGGGGTGVCPPDKPATCEAPYLDDSDNCCAPGRSCGPGACVQGECQSWLVSGKAPAATQVMDVVVAGDVLLWSSDYGQSIVRADIDGDGGVEIVTSNWAFMAGFNHFSMLAVDPEGEHVFFTDYNGRRIGRVSVQGGAPVVAALVPEAIAPGAKAGLGRILVHEAHVYWATDHWVTAAGASGIWRAPRDAGAPADAERVVDIQGAFGLAADEQHLYFGDHSTGTVKRVAWPQVGLASPVIETVASNQSAVGDVAVDAKNVYWAVHEDVRYLPKNNPGGAVSAVPTLDSWVWDIVSDGRDLYITAAGNDMNIAGALYRTPIGSGAPPVELFRAPQGNEIARGVAHDCTAVYFGLQKSAQVRKLTK